MTIPNQPLKSQSFEKSETFSTKRIFRVVWNAIAERSKGWGYTKQEQHALLLLMSLVILGAGYRVYQHRSIDRRIEVWNRSIAVKDSMTIQQRKLDLKSPIDINTADVNQLQKLSGIGPALAARIIEYRDTHGAFRTVDELEKIKGIGPRLIGELRNRISVGSVTLTFSASK